MADVLLCGSESSYVSQDVFQFNDARKTRAFPWAYFWLFLFFKQFHLSTAGFRWQNDVVLKRDIDII